jgi:hypothetical protein
MKLRTMLLAAFVTLAAAISVCAAPTAAPLHNEGVETLDDQAASDHLRQLQTRRSALFDKVARNMEQRGFSPTDIVTVVRADRKVARRGSKPSSDGIQLVETFANADGEVTIWAYDDGDDSTWEGILYFEDYATGKYAIHEAQIDVSAAAPTVIWEEQTDAGERIQPYDRERVGNFASKSRVATLIASASLHSLPRQDVQLVQQLERQKKVGGFLECLISWCSPVWDSCRWAGPLTVRCVMIGCGAAAIYCALTTL